MSASTWHRVAAASVEAERAALRAVSEAFETLRNKLATIALTEDESEDDDTNGD